MSYINDFQIIILSTLIFKNYKALEEILELLFSQVQDKGVKFNLDKTELVHFHSYKEEIIILITIIGK